jgi:hypothetical protein
MVRRLFVLIAAAAAASSLAAEPTPATGQAPSVAATQLFERDWVLMNWALKRYDANRDILIEPSEAQAAAAEFRKIADGDGDGRVTTSEYRAARAFILARY